MLAASQTCDEFGLDTMRAGGTIAFAMECVERSFTDEPWLRFGDGAALLKAMDLTTCGEGIGTLLSDGSRRMDSRGLAGKMSAWKNACGFAGRAKSALCLTPQSAHL